jgi:hypothetical protein
MKYMNMLINSMIVALYVGNIVSYPSTPGYAGGENFINVSAIKGKGIQIKNNFINISSRVAVTQNRPLARKFKDFLETDKMMQKIEKINKNGTTEATLDATALEEHIEGLLNQKEYELGAARDSCSTKRKGCMALGGGGVGLGIILAVIGSGQPPRDKQMLQSAGIGIGGFASVGAAVLYYLIEKEEVFEQHIEQIKVMRKAWTEFFSMS